jgi:hypothetical protein
MYFLVHDIDTKVLNIGILFLVFSLVIRYYVIFSCILCVAEMIHITVIVIVDKFSIALLVASDYNKVDWLCSISTFL